MAGQQGRSDPKEAALAATRCLNPHPEQVTDPGFLASEFFDARDAVQVKYEMVRKVKADGAPVTAAAAAFGYSPPARYGRRRTRPCPCSPHLATRLLNRRTARMPARTPLPAAGWTPATSTCV